MNSPQIVNGIVDGKGNVYYRMSDGSIRNARRKATAKELESLDNHEKENVNIERDWKEAWVDRMGLVVCLSGSERFTKLDLMKRDMAEQLTASQILELRATLRARFTPSNGKDVCHEATLAVIDITEDKK